MTIKTLSRRITNDLSFEILLPEQSFFFITLSLAFNVTSFHRMSCCFFLKTYNLARIFIVLDCVFTRPIAEHSFQSFTS